MAFDHFRYYTWFKVSSSVCKMVPILCLYRSHALRWLAGVVACFLFRGSVSMPGKDSLAKQICYKVGFPRTAEASVDIIYYGFERRACLV